MRIDYLMKNYKENLELLSNNNVYSSDRGAAFIAQDTGMDNIGPFTFNAVRFFVGFLAIIPLIPKKTLYNFIHKKHHEYDPPIASAALYAHPIEHLCVNLFSTVVPLFIVKANLNLLLMGRKSFWLVHLSINPLSNL